MEKLPAVQDTVRMIENIAFGEVINESGQRERLQLDLYLPAGAEAQPLATILWFHGGGFRPGNDKRQVYIPRFARSFAEAGYACVAPDYRLRADPLADLAGTVSDAVADGRLALDWVRAQGPQHGLDPARLVLAGGSAGGMLVSNLVHDPRQPVDALKDGIFAVLDLWGTPAVNDRLFPQVSRTCPPTFIVHGTADQLVPYENSRELAEELKAAGIAHQLLTLPGAPHTPLAHFDEIRAAIARFLNLHG